MNIEERRKSILNQINAMNTGPVEKDMEVKLKGLPGIIEDFENSKMENKGIVSIGDFIILSLKNKIKQVSYVYRDGVFLGKHISKNEYLVLPSSSKGLFETHTMLGNGRWLITAFSENAKYVNHRYSAPMGMRTE